jgi:hypothetical protein
MIANQPVPLIIRLIMHDGLKSVTFLPSSMFFMYNTKQKIYNVILGVPFIHCKQCERKVKAFSAPKVSETMVSM